LQTLLKMGRIRKGKKDY